MTPCGTCVGLTSLCAARARISVKIDAGDAASPCASPLLDEDAFKVTTASGKSQLDSA